MEKQSIEGLGNQILGMTVLELAELRKFLEDKTGVSAAVPMMAGPAAGAAAAGAAAAPAEEKTEFDVVLKDAGANKINVIKVVRQFTNLGLKEAKDLVDKCPNNVKEKCSKDEAAKIKDELVKVGATVEVK